MRALPSCLLVSLSSWLFCQAAFAAQLYEVMAPIPRHGRVVAVLGPTNTGKTHLAVERMLGHPTGVIGLPLRLLAREIYDRIIAAKGPRTVALVTGEEKIVPTTARWFVCTVESMPLDRGFDFVRAWVRD